MIKIKKSLIQKIVSEAMKDMPSNTMASDESDVDDSYRWREKEPKSADDITSFIIDAHDIDVLMQALNLFIKSPKSHKESVELAKLIWHDLHDVAREYY